MYIVLSSLFQLPNHCQHTSALLHVEKKEVAPIQERVELSSQVKTIYTMSSANATKNELIILANKTLIFMKNVNRYLK